MKKYLIILIAFLFIPLKVDALEIKIDEKGNNGNVMFSEKKDFELTLYKSDSSETYVSNIDKLTFDFTKYNGDILQSYSVEKNNIFSFNLDTNNYDIGTYYLDNIVCYAGSESYSYSDKIEINILTPDFESPVLNELFINDFVYDGGSLYLSTEIDDFNGISSITAIFEDSYGNGFVQNANYLSKTFVGFNNVSSYLKYGVWKIKSIQICDSSIKKNCSVYDSSNFNLDSSYFVSVNSSLELTNFNIKSINLNKRFIEKNGKINLALDLGKKYDYVFVKFKENSYISSTGSGYDNSILKLEYEDGIYKGVYDYSLLNKEYGFISNIYVFNYGGAFYSYDLNNDELEDTYFKRSKSTVDNDETYPMVFDTYFEKKEYAEGANVKTYIEFYDDRSELSKVYYRLVSFDKSHITYGSSNAIYKEGDLYYFYITLPLNKGTSYSIESISCYDESGNGVSISNPNGLTLNTHINPKSINVVSVSNKKYAINTVINTEDFKIIGDFGEDLLLDISHLVTIDQLTKIGKQKTFIRYKDFSYEIELEGFVPNVVLSKNSITVEAEETIDLSKYVSIDDSRYKDLPITYSFVKLYPNVTLKDSNFKAFQSGSFDVQICTKHEVCKVMNIKVNPIKVSDVVLIGDYYWDGHDDFSYLNLNFTPSNSDSEFLKYESLTEDIVLIDQNRNMTFKNYGIAKIRVYADYGFEKIINFEVKKAITEFKFKDDKVVMLLGDSYKIDYIVSDDNVDEKFSFDNFYLYSEDALIDGNGYFIPEKEGYYSIGFYNKCWNSLDTVEIYVVKPINNIYFDKNNIVINDGDYNSVEVKYSFDVDSDMSKYLIIKVEDEDVVSVTHYEYDNYLSIYPLKGGTTTISVTSLNGVIETFTVTVNRFFSEFSFWYPNNRLIVGEKMSPMHYLDFDYYNDVVAWSSSNSKVVSVDKMGNITAVGSGKAIIKGKTKKGLIWSTEILVTEYLVPKKVVVTSYDTNYVKVSWDKTKAKRYEVYRGTSPNSSTLIATTKNTYYIDKKVKSNKTYYYFVVDSDFSDSAVKYKITTPPSKSSITLSTYGFDTLKLKLKKMTGAARYDIYRSTSKNGTYTKVGSTTGTTYYDKNLTYGKTYYYKVKACNKNNICSGYSSYKSKKVSAGKPSITLSSSGGTVIKIKYKKVSYATKYQIYRSTSKSKNYKLVKETDSLSFTDKVIPGVTYYYKVRACGGNQCGSYSSVKSKKLTLGKTTISKISFNANKQVSLTYKKIDGAIGYEIYRSTKKNSGYKKIGTTTSTTYIDKPALGKTYYYKIKVYTKNGTKVIYSSYSGVKSIKVK